MDTDTHAPEYAPEPVSVSPHCEKKRKPAGSFMVAILFWGIVLIAGCLYGVVALSPKLLHYLQLRDNHYQTQVQLVTLERRVQYLKRVMHALENDPEFAAEQARVDMGVTRPGDEHVAVDERFHLAPDADFDPSQFKDSILPWYAPLLQVYISNKKLRRGMLIAATAMVLFAFTFLQESQGPKLMACAAAVKQGWMNATARYRKSTERPSPESPEERTVLSESVR